MGLFSREEGAGGGLLLGVFGAFNIVWLVFERDFVSQNKRMLCQKECGYKCLELNFVTNTICLLPRHMQYDNNNDRMERGTFIHLSHDGIALSC